jgi:DNA-binding CsgD family transcriptional regulator
MAHEIIQLAAALPMCPVETASKPEAKALVWVSDQDHAIVAGIDQFELALRSGLPTYLIGRRIEPDGSPAGQRLSELMDARNSGSMIVQPQQGAALRLALTLADVLTVWMARPVSQCFDSILDDVAAARQLTLREVKLASLLARNMSEAQIAQTLGISEETVRTHRRNIYAKCEVPDRGGFMMFLSGFMLA